MPVLLFVSVSKDKLLFIDFCHTNNNKQLYKQYKNVSKHRTSSNSVKTDCTECCERKRVKGPNARSTAQPRERESKQSKRVQRSKHIHSTVVKKPFSAKLCLKHIQTRRLNWSLVGEYLFYTLYFQILKTKFQFTECFCKTK